MDWYYASNGQQQGPVSQEQLIDLHKSGQVKSTDLVWNESMTDWVPLSTVPELASVAPAASDVPPMDSPPVDTGYSTSPAPYAAAGSAPVTRQQPASGETVPTYLWQSIVCLILCCLPLAIPAIIFACKVNPALEAGDIAAAREASSKAKMWCWISFGVGLVVQVAYIGLMIVGALAESGGSF